MKIAQCPADHTIVLVGRATGLDVAIDSTPLSRQGLADAVVHGYGLWRLEKGQQGHPGRLGRPPAGWKPTWGVTGAQEGAQTLHREHSCGVLAKDMRLLQVEAPQGPRPAPVTPGEHRGGPHQPDAPGPATAGQGHRSPAGPVTLHLSEQSVVQEIATWRLRAPSGGSGVLGDLKPPPSPSQVKRCSPAGLSTPRCHTCNRLVRPNELYTGIHHGHWIWVEHEECP